MLFKLAELRFTPSARWSDTLLALALDPFLVGAVLLYALLSAVWVLTFVLTVASGALLFGEAVSIWLLLGGAMIIAGLVVITR